MSNFHEATQISFTKYPMTYALSKVGGICYNRAKQKAGETSAE